MSKIASLAKVLNKGKRELGDDVWIESESGEVLSNLGFFSSVWCGGGMVLQIDCQLWMR